MATVAFLGLGLMGTPMAGRLLANGHQVTVWNRTPAAAWPLAAAGARVAPNPAAATSGSEFAITMLADAAAVRDVLTGANGLVSAPPEVLIQMSTLGPAEATGLAAEVTSAGQRPAAFLDAPVLGSVPQARAGTLRILAGGGTATFDRSRGLLTALGEPVHVGPAGAGSALKSVVNAAVAPMVALLAESLALADALGLDEDLVLDELGRSRIGSLVERKRAAIQSGEFGADSRLALFAKDMRLVLESARASGVAMPIAAAALGRAEAAIADGLGSLDYSVLVAHSRPAGRPGLRAGPAASE
ncbi:MAG TPA: NAD(P)-dependent oxidoreductase [Streptosporangiaceae bacterium]|nr:NAD(P)-dependent oxidoreductase [Streptosporangiaceae bacterium]